MRPRELGGQRGAHGVVDAVGIVNQRVGVAHDELIARRQVGVRAIRDAGDRFFIETLLLRTCEAKVLSNTAVDKIGVA